MVLSYLMTLLTVNVKHEVNDGESSMQYYFTKAAFHVSVQSKDQSFMACAFSIKKVQTVKF